MVETVLVGKGRHFEQIPRDSWEEKVAIESQHIPAVLDFMTKEHHRVRNLVVEEIARKASPVSSKEISTKLNLPQSQVIAILDDLEKNLFFLVRNPRGDVSWAFPETKEKTPHKLTFNAGVPEKNNFHQYRMIRVSEAPKKIDVHFVENDIDPTGLGEPTFPPAFGALANALYKATGKRFYNQPFNIT